MEGRECLRALPPLSTYKWEGDRKKLYESIQQSVDGETSEDNVSPRSHVSHYWLYCTQMINENQIQSGKAILMKYCLPDCLKPEYDGMMARDIVEKILIAAEVARETDEVITEDMALDAKEIMQREKIAREVDQAVEDQAFNK